MLNGLMMLIFIREMETAGVVKSNANPAFHVSINGILYVMLYRLSSAHSRYSLQKQQSKASIREKAKKKIADHTSSIGSQTSLSQSLYNNMQCNPCSQFALELNAWHSQHLKWHFR